MLLVTVVWNVGIGPPSVARRWLRWRWLLVQRRYRFSRMPTHDRDILETRIFRRLFLDGTRKRILFVGCDFYTSWYKEIFDEASGFRFTTVDPDPDKAPFGSRADHLVARLEDLARMPERHDSFDIVVINGVFNYGIDSDEQKRASLAVCCRVLRRGGLLVVGYRNAPGRPDLARELVPHQLVAHVIPGLRASEFQTRHSNFHAFICYERI